MLFCSHMFELLWSQPSLNQETPAIISSPCEAGLNRMPRVVDVWLNLALLAYLAVSCGVTRYKWRWVRESRAVSMAVVTPALQTTVAGYPTIMRGLSLPSPPSQIHLC